MRIRPNDPNFLRLRRGQLGLTQRRVAADMGVTIESIVRWEHGRSVPRASYLLAMASAYQTDIEAIKTWAGEVAVLRGVA